MKMLDLITLQVIENIFDSTNKVQALSKSLYINCIIKHFKYKDATIENAMGFEMKVSEIPNYQKFHQNFLDLHQAQIVQCDANAIVFLNKWGQLIDRTKLNGVQVGSVMMKNVKEYEDELIANTSMIDVICMKNRMSKSQVVSLIKIFLLEQDATQAVHRDSSDIAKHFIYWVGTNLDKIDLSTEIVRSKSKILGLE